MEVQEQTSLKGMFQGMIPDSMGVLQGMVVSAEPLAIQVANDKKLVLHANLLCIPKQLTDYRMVCDIEIDKGGVKSKTKKDSTGHVHDLEDFELVDAIVTVNNGLKEGDSVYLLSFNEGKKYYVLDREV